MADVVRVDLEQWLKPADALARLPASWDDRAKRTAIVRRICDSSIRLVARSGVVKDLRGARQLGLTIIDPVLWSHPWNARDRDFWLLGDISFDNAPPPQVVFVVSLDDPPDREAQIATASYKDARLEPDAFEREFAGYLPVEVADEAGAPGGSPIAAARLRVSCGSISNSGVRVLAR